MKIIIRVMWGRIIPKILIVWDFENGPVLDTYWLDGMCVRLSEVGKTRIIVEAEGRVVVEREHVALPCRHWSRTQNMDSLDCQAYLGEYLASPCVRRG